MAEGWARHLKGDVLEAHSAGTSARRLNRRAVQVMAEVGVDISRQKPKHLDAVSHVDFDLVVTVCERAATRCPVFPRKARVLHRPFDDPPALAKGAETEEAALAHFRRVRDELRALVESLPGLVLD